VSAYIVECKKCGQPFEADWDSELKHLPVAEHCPNCGYSDGYRAGELTLVGAFSVTCSHCHTDFAARIPGAAVDPHNRMGLSEHVPLRCPACGVEDQYGPDEVRYDGPGEPLPLSRAKAIGSERA
jgi:DNA-directed RNA polymerase subunit RPC12/RpoP